MLFHCELQVHLKKKKTPTNGLHTFCKVWKFKGSNDYSCSSSDSPFSVSEKTSDESDKTTGSSRVAAIIAYICMHVRGSVIAKRKWRHDSDKTQTNKPEWRTIFLKHFLKQPVFLKHIFQTKTLPRFPLVLSDRAGVVWASSGISSFAFYF